MHTTLPTPRGFAAMTAEQQREIARRGGIAAQAKGTAQKFTSDEASRAGRKAHNRHQLTPEKARIVGRLGGIARARVMAARPQQLAAIAIANIAARAAQSSPHKNPTPPASLQDSGVTSPPQPATQCAAGAFATDAHGTDVPVR